MSHHVDRLFSAISALASHGPIKQRLIRAYEDNLDIIEEDDLPISVRESFSDLRRMMHAVSPANGEGPICASVRKMSKIEADDCAQLMVDIYGDLTRSAEGSAEAHMAMKVGPRPAVPPFLVKSG
jgi:hypothetical protein